MSMELQQIIASNGDIRLAAERSGKTVSELTVSLMSAPLDLQMAIRASMSLQLLDLLSNVKVALIAALGEMAPKDIAKLLVDTMGGFNELWDEGTVNNNSLINIQGVGGDSSPARDKLASRLAELVSTAEGN